EKVAGVVELMVVAQVRPALVDLAADVPEVQVAVRQLRAGKLLGDVVDLCLDRRVAAVVERVARRLDPLADVGVPEDLGGEADAVARDAQGGRRLAHQQRLEQAVLLELAVLAGDRAREHGVQPLAPEGAFDTDIGEGDRRELAHALLFHLFSCPCAHRVRAGLVPPHESRMTSVLSSRCTPLSRLPAIMSSRRRPASWPRSRRLMSPLVSGGRAASKTTSQVSKPIRETASGTAIPCSRSASAAPRAIWSLPQKMLSGGPRRSSRRRATASRPQASDQTPGR